MGWFDGFPFVSKKERERRSRDFQKRVAPFGVDEQREKLRKTLEELFPGMDQTDVMFTYYNAKDAYTYEETKDESEVAARRKLRRARWMDGQKETIMMRLLEMEMAITSLDEYPTGKDVLKGLYDED